MYTDIYRRVCIKWWRRASLFTQHQSGARLNSWYANEERSDDADGFVSRARQRGRGSLLDGQEDQSDVVAADVAQGSQQVGHRRVLAFGPVGEQVAGGARLLLGRALLEGGDPRRRVAQVAGQRLPVPLVPPAVQHHLHLATLGRANVSQTRFQCDCS